MKTYTEAYTYKMPKDRYFQYRVTEFYLRALILRTYISIDYKLVLPPTLATLFNCEK